MVRAQDQETRESLRERERERERESLLLVAVLVQEVKIELLKNNNSIITS